MIQIEHRVKYKNWTIKFQRTAFSDRLMTIYTKKLVLLLLLLVLTKIKFLSLDDLWARGKTNFLFFSNFQKIETLFLFLICILKIEISILGNWLLLFFLFIFLIISIFLSLFYFNFFSYSLLFCQICIKICADSRILIFRK